MSVARGEVSEGIDFDHNCCRAVIMFRYAYVLFNGGYSSSLSGFLTNIWRAAFSKRDLNTCEMHSDVMARLGLEAVALARLSRAQA